MERIKFDVVVSEEARLEKEALLLRLKEHPRIVSWLKQYQQPFSVVENNAYKFSDYIARSEGCITCVGLSQCMQKTKGHILALVYDDTLSKRVQACRYQQEKNNGLAHRARYSLCDMSDQQLMYSFESIDMSEEKDSYLKLVAEMIDTCRSGSTRGFYLCGEPGTGKTFLAGCYLNAMAKQGKKCAFINVSNYFATLKSKMNDKDAYQKQLAAFKNADVVALDDIGGESVSNWTRDEILLPILNERMEQGRTTLFTSNYSMGNVEKYYAANSKLVNDTVGAKRLVERIKALSCEKVLNCKNRR